MKIKVTSNPTLVPGHADYLLRRLNAFNVATLPDGTVEAEVDSETLRKFNILGGAHKVEVVVEPAPAPPVEVPVPTVEEVIEAGYSPEAAPRIVERQQRIADLVASGMSEKDVMDTIYQTPGGGSE